MKKISYIVALLVSLLYAFIALGATLASQNQQDVTSVGLLPTPMFVLLSIIIAGSTFIGSVGGLLNKSWAWKLALGGFGLSFIINLLQGNPANSVIALVVLALVYFKGR